MSLLKSLVINSCRKFPKNLGRRNFFGDAKEKQDKRAKILSDFKKGYLADLKEVKATGGKRFLALSETFSPQESLILPKVNGISINGNSVSLPQDIFGRITLLLLWTREHGQRTCDVYRETFTKEFHQTENTAYYEVNILDSWLFRKLQSYIRGNLKKQVPPDRQDHFLCCYDYEPKVIETLFENSLVGHAVLVDTAGRIRWKAHGTPTAEELMYLLNCTNYLRQETTNSR